jgi:hypothetical protein
MSAIEHDLPDETGETDVTNNDQETQHLTSGDQPSILEQLAAARQDAADNQTVDIDLPGYNGALVARYGLIDQTDLAKIAKRVRKQYKKQEQQVLAMSCDILITACEGLMYRNDEGELDTISKDGETLNYHNAGSFLKFEATSARDSVIQVFAGNEIAVIDQQVRLSRWMRNTGVDVQSDLLGE